MKNIIGRIRRLENATVPVDRERAIVESILEARRQRMDADHEPFPSFPPESYAGCRSVADQILRARVLYQEHRRSTDAATAAPECSE